MNEKPKKKTKKKNNRKRKKKDEKEQGTIDDSNAWHGTANQLERPQENESTELQC